MSAPAELVSVALPFAAPRRHPVPAYLREIYGWAYLSRWGQKLFDREWAVNAILMGNANRLMRAAAEQVAPGQRVLQVACVYGDFSQRLAERVGPRGTLHVTDVAPIQVRGLRRKLAGIPQARVAVHDAARPFVQRYDTVVCFFLLHEVPDGYKRMIVDNVLAAVAPGGRAVFVDYHRPRRWNPARLVLAPVFSLLEPYARALLGREVRELSHDADAFDWDKQTFFGGTYQCVVARARQPG